MRKLSLRSLQRLILGTVTDLGLSVSLRAFQSNCLLGYAHSAELQAAAVVVIVPTWGHAGQSLAGTGPV